MRSTYHALCTNLDYLDLNKWMVTLLTNNHIFLFNRNHDISSTSGKGQLSWSNWENTGKIRMVQHLVQPDPHNIYDRLICMTVWTWDNRVECWYLYSTTSIKVFSFLKLEPVQWTLVTSTVNISDIYSEQ